MSPSQFSHLLSYSGALVIPFSAFFLRFIPFVSDVQQYKIFQGTFQLLFTILLLFRWFTLQKCFFNCLYCLFFCNILTFPFSSHIFIHTILESLHIAKKLLFTIHSLCNNNSTFFFSLLSYRVILSIIILFLLLNKIRYVWSLISAPFYCTEKK